MRPGEFFDAMFVYREEQNLDREHLGELVRGATLRLVNLQLRPGDRIRDPKKFWPMPWDKIEAISEDAEISRLEGLTDAERTAEAHKLLKKLGYNGK